MIARLLFTLTLIQISLNNLSTNEINQNAPLTIKIPQNSRFTQMQIQQVKKQFQLDSILNTEMQKCEQDTDCHKLIIIDSQTNTTEQILLPASTSRIKQSLMRHLMQYQRKINEQKIRNKKKLNKQSVFKVKSKEQNKFSKNLLAQQGSQEKDDWERAHLITIKVDQIPKLKTTSSTISAISDPKQANTLKTDQGQPKSDVVTRQQSEIYKWYFIYILLSAIVIFGMKYMSQQEKRLLQLSNQFAHCPHHCNQEESV